MTSFTFQPSLRPALPCIYGPLDYREQRALFERIDGILAVSGLEQEFINLALTGSKIDADAISPNPSFFEPAQIRVFRGENSGF
jgi:hypothetical protein